MTKEMDMAKTLSVAACGVVAVLALRTPAHAQSVRAAGPARYLVPQSVAGVLVRFAGVSRGGAGTQYTYGTDRPPTWTPTTMQAPRTGTWYDVALGFPFTGRSVVGAVASQYAAGWRGRLTHGAVGESLVATNGRVCLAMVGTDGTRAAIVVVVGQAGHDCRAAQARATRVALFVRGRA